LPFRQEKQKINAELAEKKHSKAKNPHAVSAPSALRLLGCGYSAPRSLRQILTGVRGT
jgi:hypothetical protein